MTKISRLQQLQALPWAVLLVIVYLITWLGTVIVSGVRNIRHCYLKCKRRWRRSIRQGENTA